MKAAYPIGGPFRGQYLGDGPNDFSTGADGLRVGDGFHDDVLVSFVSCSCLGRLPPRKTVVGATLKLTTSGVFGPNPFTTPGKVRLLKVDMVRGCWACHE